MTPSSLRLVETSLWPWLCTDPPTTTLARQIVAMTCTHAALKRREFIELAFKYDNLLMEEAAQILEIETFIPMLLQRQEDGGAEPLPAFWGADSAASGNSCTLPRNEETVSALWLRCFLDPCAPS